MKLQNIRTASDILIFVTAQNAVNTFPTNNDEKRIIAGMFYATRNGSIDPVSVCQILSDIKAL